MDIEFKQNEVIISMKDYLRDMIREFPLELKSIKVTSPASSDMFSEDKSKRLGEKEKEIFHRIVAKGRFFVKKGQT